MRDPWDRTDKERFARAAFYYGDPGLQAGSLRELRIAVLIAGAPVFPMEEVADVLMLKMQGGLRDRDLN